MEKEMLKFNCEFVEAEKYKAYETSKYPRMKTAIVTCMDTRLVELLPAALGIKNGDVKMIKNAGGTVDDPFGSTMRSLLIAIYELGVENVMIIGHTTCGVEGMNAEEMMNNMMERGVKKDTFRMLQNCGIDLEKWLTGFEDIKKAVLKSVETVRNHPLITPDIKVSGYVMDTATGKLQPLD